MRPTRSTIFPYTTLFRSIDADALQVRAGQQIGAAAARLRKHFHPLFAARGIRRFIRVVERAVGAPLQDRKSTRLNSSHSQISYAVFCLKKKKNTTCLIAV